MTLEWPQLRNFKALKRIGPLSESPETRASLLIRVRDTTDHLAWQEFVSIYAPLIHGYSLRRGLQDADAADIAQTVLQSIARAIPGFEYNSSRGSFRGWLFTITRNALIKALEKRAKAPTATGESSFHLQLLQQPDGTDDEEIWNREHERHLFRWASEQVKAEFSEQTWQAFRLVSVENVAVAEVASKLDMSPGAIYISKSRVTARLRTVIESVED